MNEQRLIEKIRLDFSTNADEKIDANTELLMSGLVDSLAVVGLISWLEEQVGTSIDPGLITPDNFETPAAILALCERFA